MIGEPKDVKDVEDVVSRATASPSDALNTPPPDPFQIVLDASERPAALPLRSRWIAVFIICFASTCVTCTSSMAAATFPGLERRFHISDEVATLSISLYILGLGLGPLIFGGLSEIVGRNLIYRGTFLVFFLLNFPVAFANNIAVHLVFRFLTGFCGSAFLVVGGGSIADLFPPNQVLLPVAIYTLSPLLGPFLGPLISGFINQRASWRVTFYVVLGWSAVQGILLSTLVPETYIPALTNDKAARVRRETGDSRYFSAFDNRSKSVATILKISISKPFLLMFYEPMVLLLDIWSALLLGIVYMTFAIFPIVFEGVHGFSLQFVGLSYLGIGVGTIIGTATQYFWNRIDVDVRAKYQARGEKVPPEMCLFQGMAGALLAPLGLFLFAFTLYPEVHWIVPIIVIMPFGVALVYAFNSIVTFLVSTYRPHAASAMASNGFLRSVFACGLPLAAKPMLQKMTNVGAMALLAGLTLLMAPLPFVFFWLGPRLRRRSRYAV